MIDLAARVLAAIKETEQIAEDATGTPWIAEVTGTLHVDPAAIRDNKLAYGHLGYVAGSDPGPQGDAFRKHIARQDPAASLRRCAADRRTVQRHEPQRGSGPYGRLGCQWCSSDDRPTSWPCPDLLDRADAYGITTEEATHG